MPLDLSAGSFPRPPNSDRLLREVWAKIMAGGALRQGRLFGALLGRLAPQTGLPHYDLIPNMSSGYVPARTLTRHSITGHRARDHVKMTL
jgi:hypothetical protein